MMLDWTSILVQIPIVASFIWFAVQTQKNNQTSSENKEKAFMAALQERDKLYEERNQALVAALMATTVQITEMTKTMISHDAWTKEAVSLMIQRAADRK